MRYMYDAVNINAAIPDNPQLIAGYIDGNYQSFDGLSARFPNAIHVPIAVWPSTNGGIVLDVETGDATPDQAPPWVRMRRAASVHPTVYCSLAVWDQVRQSFQSAGVEEPEYWIAAYPGNGENLYPGSIAHQFGGDTDGGYDISVVADYWPGVDPTPVPPTPPIELTEDSIMITAYEGADGTQHAYYVGEDQKPYYYTLAKGAKEWVVTVMPGFGGAPSGIVGSPVPFGKQV